ncbi:MAG TPA: hypothetical protein VGK74_11480 [Symbiobacteriaceae bacterium]|jgi:hypothetical protein
MPTTKSAGADWALRMLDERWHQAVRAAVSIRCGRYEDGDGDLVRQSLPELRWLLRSRYC